MDRSRGSQWKILWPQLPGLQPFTIPRGHQDPKPNIAVPPIFPGFTTRALAAKLSRSIKQDFTFVYIGWSRHRVITPIVLSRASPKDHAIVVSVVPVEACINLLLTGNNECGRYRVCGIRYKIIISFSFHITKLEMKINLLYILMCRNFQLIEKTRGSAAGCAFRPNPCLLAKIN